MADATKKKRKWDVPGAPPSTEETATGSTEDPTAAVTIAAKKLNAMLAASGVANIQAFEQEIDVNNCRPETRYHLCKGTTHDEIAEKTGATIRVRGKYKPPGDTSFERPLHLYITATNQKSLEAAAAKVYEIMRNDQQKQQALSANQGVQFIGKVFVGMEGTDAQFDVISKILGPNNSYLNHIQNTSKATVVLKGVGSGTSESGSEGRESTDPLQLYINAKTKQNLDNAKSLCENLCSTIRQEYYVWQQQKQSYQQYYSYPNNNYYSYGNQGYGYGAYQNQTYGGYPYQTYQDPSQATTPSTTPPASNGYAPPPPPSSIPPPPPPSTTPAPPPPSSTPAPPPPVSSKPPPPPETTQVGWKSQEQKEEKKGEKKEEKPSSGSKLPPSEDEFSFYSEIAQIDKKPKASTGGQGTKQTNSQQSRNNEKKTEGSIQSNFPLVDYADEDENKVKTTTAPGNKPFWAAPSALDDAETNPLKQREKVEAKLNSLKEDVYNELGLN